MFLWLPLSSGMVRMSEEAVQKRQQLLNQEMAMFEQMLEEYGRCANAQVKMCQDTSKSIRCQIERERQKAEQELVQQYEKVEKLLDINHHVKMSGKQLELSVLDLEETTIRLREARSRLVFNTEFLYQAMAVAVDQRETAEDCIKKIDALPEWERDLKNMEPLKVCANEVINEADEFERQFMGFKLKDAQIQAANVELKKLAKLELENGTECSKVATQWNMENDAIKKRFIEFNETTAVTSSRQNNSAKFNEIIASCQSQMERGKKYVALCQERIEIQRDAKKCGEQLTQLYKEQNLCEKEIGNKAAQFTEKATRFSEALNECLSIAASVKDLINGNLG